MVRGTYLGQRGIPILVGGTYLGRRGYQPWLGDTYLGRKGYPGVSSGVDRYTPVKTLSSHIPLEIWTVINTPVLY